jgi:hypothetical protein
MYDVHADVYRYTRHVEDSAEAVVGTVGQHTTPGADSEVIPLILELKYHETRYQMLQNTRSVAWPSYDNDSAYMHPEPTAAVHSETIL